MSTRSEAIIAFLLLLFFALGCMFGGFLERENCAGTYGYRNTLTETVKEAR